jgi:hypothetical protein
MTQYLIKQLADEITTPDSGKQSVVLADDPKTKVVLFSFAPGSGLAEHVAPFDASTPRGPSLGRGGRIRSDLPCRHRPTSIPLWIGS